MTGHILRQGTWVAICDGRKALLFGEQGDRRISQTRELASTLSTRASRRIFKGHPRLAGPSARREAGEERLNNPTSTIATKSSSCRNSPNAWSAVRAITG